uniref:ABC transporter permease n=1 Tax=Thaumasiovibrio subtropicus TaxID=1891207 RepID=UPI001864FF42|nr:ABC transporter permease [Thaumasiovibrio subtropicus]
MWRTLTHAQRIGLAILCSFGLFLLIEALCFNYDPALQNLSNAFATPTWQEPLGTDQFGRSNVSRLADAIITSLSMAVLSVITSALLGISAGVLAGWKQGWWDRSFSFAVNVILAMPGLVLVLLFGAIVPGSFLILYMAISLILSIEYFRVVRSHARTAVNSPAVEASQLYGFSDWYIFKRHLWPACRRDVLVLACFGAGNAILALASIGFLHVGLRPPHAELGLMMVELFRYYQDAPWVLLQPIIVIMLLVFSFYLLTQGEDNDIAN